MIKYLDKTLESFLTAEVVPKAQFATGTVKVEFAPPNEAWLNNVARGMALNCYLYDVRENQELRRADQHVVRSGQKGVRRRAPARLNCRYCITSWKYPPATYDPEIVYDEHHLLGVTFQELLRYQTIPSRYWQGGIGDQLPPYPIVDVEAGALPNAAEFWGALQQPARPCLIYTVILTVPIDDRAPTVHTVENYQVNLHQAEAATATSG